MLDAYARYFVKFVEAYKGWVSRCPWFMYRMSPWRIRSSLLPVAWQRYERFYQRDIWGRPLKSGLGTDLAGDDKRSFVDFRWPGYSAPVKEFYDQFANTILSDKGGQKIS